MNKLPLKSLGENMDFIFLFPILENIVMLIAA